MSYGLSTAVNEIKISPFARDHWDAAQTVRNLSPENQAKQNALIRAEVKVLRTAYMVQTKNMSNDDLAAIEKLWKETFACVDPFILHEAVMRFIKKDRKGFFPAPGLIIGYIEEIVSEIKWRQIELLERQRMEQ